MTTTTSSDGALIAYDQLGDGAPVVIVAGALGARGSNAGLAELLAARYTVFNYDRRGRGDSGDTAPYAPEREVEDLAAVIAAAGGSASLFGSSSGGNLALATARVADVSKLALWEPNFVVDASRAPLPPDYVATLERLVAEDRRGDAVAYFMTAAVGLPEAMVDQMRQATAWAAMESLAHTLAYDGAVVGDSMSGSPPAEATWEAVKIPTLVLDGGATPWLTGGADAIAGALVDARRQTLSGQTHDVSAEALAPALSEFFG
jgi:hypothetical protein